MGENEQKMHTLAIVELSLGQHFSGLVPGPLELATFFGRKCMVRTKSMKSWMKLEI